MQAVLQQKYVSETAEVFSLSVKDEGVGDGSQNS